MFRNVVEVNSDIEWLLKTFHFQRKFMKEIGACNFVVCGSDKTQNTLKLDDALHKVIDFSSYTGMLHQKSSNS